MARSESLEQAIVLAETLIENSKQDIEAIIAGFVTGQVAHDITIANFSKAVIELKDISIALPLMKMKASELRASA